MESSDIVNIKELGILQVRNLRRESNNSFYESAQNSNFLLLAPCYVIWAEISCMENA
jgi:hypothetical protein